MSDLNPMLLIDVTDAEEALEAAIAQALVLPVAVLSAGELSEDGLEILEVVTVTLQATRRLAGSDGRTLSHSRLTPENLSAFERLIHALYGSELRYLRTVMSREQRVEIVGRATSWLHLLSTEEDALVVQGWLASESSKRKPAGSSERSSVARQLARLTQRFRNAWPEIEAHTQLEPADIREAEHLAFWTLGALEVGPRVGPRVGKEEAYELRKQLYHLVVKRYEEIRRALHYVRMDSGDADKLAPPLTVRAKPPSEPLKQGVRPSVNCTATTKALHRGTTNAALAADTQVGFRQLFELLKSKSLAN